MRRVPPHYPSIVEESWHIDAKNCTRDLAVERTGVSPRASQLKFQETYTKLSCDVGRQTGRARMHAWRGESRTEGRGTSTSWPSMSASRLCLLRFPFLTRCLFKAEAVCLSSGVCGLMQSLSTASFAEGNGRKLLHSLPVMLHGKWDQALSQIVCLALEK